MTWLGTNTASPEPLKLGLYHEYCLSTAHLLLTHTRVPVAICIQPFLRSVSYCTFLSVECWAIRRDQLATNTSSEGHCCIPTADISTPMLAVSESILNTLSGFLPRIQPAPLLKSGFIWPGRYSCCTASLYVLSRTHTHTYSASNNASLKLSCFLKDPTWKVCCLDQCPWNPSLPACIVGTAHSGVCGSVHEGLPYLHGSASPAASQNHSELHSPL